MITVTIDAKPLPPFRMTGPECVVGDEACAFAEAAVRMGLRVTFSASDYDASVMGRLLMSQGKSLGDPWVARLRAARRVRHIIRMTMHNSRAEMFPCRPVTPCPTENELLAKMMKERGIS